MTRTTVRRSASSATGDGGVPPGFRVRLRHALVGVARGSRYGRIARPSDAGHGFVALESPAIRRDADGAESTMTELRVEYDNLDVVAEEHDVPPLIGVSGQPLRVAEHYRRDPTLPDTFQFEPEIEAAFPVDVLELLERREPDADDSHSAP